MSSIFTRIVRGEIPAARVYEDALTLAFLDINPAALGHTLVICKPEIASLLDLTPELVSATALTVQRVARAMQQALQPAGINIVQNNGSAAGQVVFHYHVHIIPRFPDDGVLRHWRPGTATADELRTAAERIAAFC
jgi:histidine triad (HIT) family protein